MRVFGTEAIDYLPAIAAAAAAAVYVATAYGYSPDARAAPLLIGWSVIALAGLDTAGRTQTAAGRALTRWLNPGVSRSHPAAGSVYTTTRQASAVAWIVGFVAAFALFGALVAIPLYVFAAIYWRGGRPIWVGVISAAGTLAGIWVLFARLLHLDLYPGLLFGGT
jgi:hypothetical protein